MPYRASVIQEGVIALHLEGKMPPLKMTEEQYFCKILSYGI
jgi:hypothetical protein